MSVQEIGAYLRGKIRENGLKVGVVQKTAGVASNYIWRLETGKIEQPSIKALKALTEAVRGQWSEVQAYLKDIPDLVFTDEELTQIDTIIRETPDPDLAAILNDIREENKYRPIVRALRAWLQGWRAAHDDD